MRITRDGRLSLRIAMLLIVAVACSDAPDTMAPDPCADVSPCRSGISVQFSGPVPLAFHVGLVAPDQDSVLVQCIGEPCADGVFLEATPVEADISVIWADTVVKVTVTPQYEPVTSSSGVCPQECVLATVTVPLERFPWASDASLPDSVRQRYSEDAAHLAVRRINEENPPDMQPVEIPTDLRASLYEALIQVQANGHPAADSVGHVYAVHAKRRPNIHSVLLAVDTSTVWLDAWRNGTTLTGDPEMDALITQYDLELTWLNEGFPPTTFGKLTSSRALNITALALLFEPIPGIVWAELSGGGGDGNDITARWEDWAWEFDYSLGWGFSCFSGCPNRRHWGFRVEATGRVVYLGSSGDPAPDPCETQEFWGTC